jgi:hypothetical protein
VARRLHVTRPARTRPLLVGGDPWVIDLARALRSAGLEVVMWAGSDDQREQITQAGLELMPGELLAAATGEGAELEGITAVLLLTDEDDFNALAATVLAGDPETRVYRLAPRHPTHGVVAPFSGEDAVFAPTLTRHDVAHRYQTGAQITTAPADGDTPPGTDILFRIDPNGRLTPATTSRAPTPQPGDTLVLLGPTSWGRE